MGEPCRLMMVMVGGSGMPHPRERCARGSVEREEERTLILLSKIPAELFDAIDAHGDLMVGERYCFASWNGEFGVVGLHLKKTKSGSENQI